MSSPESDRRGIARRARWMLAALAVASAPACTATNVTDAGAAGPDAIVFASNREDGNYEIYLVSGAGEGLRRLTFSKTQTDLAPRLSPDGRRIAWEREVGLPGGGVAAQLWVMNADGGGQHLVLDNGAENRSPDWSADGKSLYYASYVTGNWEIFRLDLASGATTNLTNNPFADQYPRVSPDGSRIAFQSNRDYNFEIYVMSSSGAAPTNITRSAADDRFPAWTPDGTRIVWSPFGTTFDVWVANADGSGAHALAASSFAERNPSVSPDGERVIFQSDQRAPFGLFVMPLAGGPARLLVADDASASDIQPSWGARAP